MTAVETNVAVREPQSGHNPLKLKRIHHVEFLAGNASDELWAEAETLLRRVRPRQ